MEFDQFPKIPSLFCSFRERVLDEFGKELNEVFSAWELDLQKSREANEEMEVRK